jgi:hypothetical protein
MGGRHGDMLAPVGDDVFHFGRWGRHGDMPVDMKMNLVDCRQFDRAWKGIQGTMREAVRHIAAERRK